MAVVGFLVFAIAFAASMVVFCGTLVPALPRILALLRDGDDPIVNGASFTTFSAPRVRARVRMAPALVQPSWRAAA